MKKLNITIVGGGSTYTSAMLKTICDFKDKLPIGKLVLYDIDEERQERVGKFTEILLKERYPEIEAFYYTTDKKEAFEDIDFALMQIRSGGLKMREKDEKIPLKHQAVGQETCGAGGFAYGMRTIGDFIELVNDIRKYSPDAWIINYSNPAAIVAEATKRVFPEDKRLINICDMPIAMMEAFSTVLGTTRQKLSPRYFGLNHFGWFTALYDDTGKDRLPEIYSFLKEREILPSESEMLDKSWQDTFKQLAVMVRDIDGYIPNTYMQYYLYPTKIVEKSNPDYTRANEVMDGREKRVFSMLDEIIEKGTIEGSPIQNGVHGDYIIELVSSIMNNENKIFLIITENKGAIENLPSDAMVEIPCLVNANGVEPLRVGPIPTFYKGLIENQFAYEKLTVDAYFNNSYDNALKALVLNRTIVDTPKAKAILNDLIEANKSHWPTLK